MLGSCSNRVGDVGASVGIALLLLRSNRFPLKGKSDVGAGASHAASSGRCSNSAPRWKATLEQAVLGLVPPCMVQGGTCCLSAKVTERLWEIGDMVDVLEAWEAKRERPAAARVRGLSCRPSLTIPRIGASALMKRALWQNK
jgi:hypothetical protein